MNIIFQQHLENFIFVYLDNFLVFSKTEEEYLEHLRKVFDILDKNKLYVKLIKC